MAQWAKEAELPCFLPSASIPNGGKARKRKESLGETSTPPAECNGYKTAARDPVLLRELLPDVQLLKTHQWIHFDWS